MLFHVLEGYIRLDFLIIHFAKGEFIMGKSIGFTSFMCGK